MRFRGSTSLVAARPVDHRPPRRAILWHAAIEAWLRRLPTSPLRDEALRAMAKSRDLVRGHYPEVTAAGIDRWTTELGCAVAVYGAQGDAAATWAAVSVWDESGGHWSTIARAVEAVARSADDLATAGDADRRAAVLVETGRAATALLARMDAREAGIWRDGR